MARQTIDDDEKHLTDRAASALRGGREHASERPDAEANVPGPSPNPMTNALIQEVLLRGVGRLTRQTAQKALIGKRYGANFAKDAVENRSLLHTLATYGVARTATKSVPGAVLVGGGLLLKTLYDRAQGKKAARRAGERTLRKQAREDSAI